MAIMQGNHKDSLDTGSIVTHTSNTVQVDTIVLACDTILVPRNVGGTINRALKTVTPNRYSIFEERETPKMIKCRVS